MHVAGRWVLLGLWYELFFEMSLCRTAYARWITRRSRTIRESDFMLEDRLNESRASHFQLRSQNYSIQATRAQRGDLRTIASKVASNKAPQHSKQRRGK